MQNLMVSKKKNYLFKDALENSVAQDHSLLSLDMLLFIFKLVITSFVVLTS